MFDVISYAKNHALLLGTAALIGVVGFFYIYEDHGGGSAAGSTASGTGGLTALYASEAEQQTQLEAQQSSITGQQNIAQIQANYGLQTAQLSASVALAQNMSAEDVANNTIAANLAAAQLSAGVSVDQISAQLSGLESNNQTSEALAVTAANENTSIANISANLQSAISNNQTQVAIQQTNAAVSIAKNQSSAGLFGEGIGAVASLL